MQAGGEVVQEEQEESMRRSIVGGLMAAGMLLGGLAITSSSAVSADQPVDLHCPDKDNPNKVETSDESFVPPAGAEVCVKGGTSNTGKIFADGKTVGQYLDQVTSSGVSYYIVYSVPEQEPDPAKLRLTFMQECGTF